MIKSAIKLFRVKRIRIKKIMELDGKSIVTHFPDDTGYVDSDGENYFEKCVITFMAATHGDPDTDFYFSVCIDDCLYIGSDFKLYDDMAKAGNFGKTVKKDGKVLKVYNCITDRAMGVVAAVMQGKIKLGEMKK